METKYILCNAPDGQYLIPLIKIAEHRANYYSEVDGFAIGGKEYQEEIDFVFRDRIEGIDWLLCNTNWEDWAEVAIKESDKVFVDENFWFEFENFEIVKRTT